MDSSISITFDQSSNKTYFSPVEDLPFNTVELEGYSMNMLRRACKYAVTGETPTMATIRNGKMRWKTCSKNRRGVCLHGFGRRQGNRSLFLKNCQGQTSRSASLM